MAHAGLESIALKPWVLHFGCCHFSFYEPNVTLFENSVRWLAYASAQKHGSQMYSLWSHWSGMLKMKSDKQA